jgi:hypothetical protein
VTPGPGSTWLSWRGCTVPAAREAGPDTVVLADGFSCRTQLAAGHAGAQGWHLAQLLAQVTRPGSAGSAGATGEGIRGGSVGCGLPG